MVADMSVAQWKSLMTSELEYVDNLLKTAPPLEIQNLKARKLYLQTKMTELDKCS